MFEVFGELKKQITTSGDTKPRVGSMVFFSAKLCMFITLLACVLVTAKNYIGDNIKCITGFEKQEHKAIETYCFIASTFTIVDLNADLAPHPGVGPAIPKINAEGEKEEATRGNAYYQWVPMVLVLQAVFYYLPIWIWDRIDKGFFQSVLCQLDKIHISDVSKNVESSARYFVSSMATHRSYGVFFLLCECSIFAISVGNLFFTNTFLGGEFFKFGPSAIKYLGTSATDPNNPLNEIFPKVAKCTWHKYGASGTIQKFDSMCVLPLNIVNEKTYIFLWLVYIVTAAICGFVLILHLLLFFLSSLRNTVLVHLTHKHQTKQDPTNVLLKCNYGDWFLIYHFKSNMAYFSEWVASVKQELQK
ncbi:LOW QUALITY PROTEIN: innexin inx1-like [Homarus americanus]|uniref:LOW QUALITY PROTEIN: innexin inx1-like n=1 Tax=Homarus americanus TaxID=6706 RepID=UPI001C45E826|nr:LOW QUALITY PROTEIN: innexin inx1-like [Homarus americanus]